jgi:hypothetical protein
VEPDDPQKQRSPRAGAATYQAIASEGKIPDELVDLYFVE